MQGVAMLYNTYNVLFICTGNSARSIMAEAILNKIGEGRFRAFSGGSQPVGRVHPQALHVLQRLNHPTSELRSKHWYEFTAEAAPRLDFVFTVGDQPARQSFPIWPGQPMRAY